MKLVLVLSTLFISIFTFAQSPNEQIKRFFDLYRINQVEAVKKLMTENTVSKVKESDLTNLLNDVKKIDVSIVGKFNDYELIAEKNVSNTIILNSYIVKHQNIPLRFSIAFYKPENDWKVFHFSYDAKLMEELIESSKLYYQNLDSY